MCILIRINKCNRLVFFKENNRIEAIDSSYEAHSNNAQWFKLNIW